MSEQRHPHGSGSGPGALTPDGCAVDLYALLPAGETPGLIHGAIPAGASVLDLGAGVGRLADRLVDLGHTVLAVDESAAMLERVSLAETVCSTIEDLHLDRDFDVVLLASHLVNVPDESARARLLATCARHVRAEGVVLIERHTRAWVTTVKDQVRDTETMTTELTVHERPGPGLVTATVEYRVGDRRWTQSFTARGLDDDELAAALAPAGLHLDRWLTDDGKWVAAVRRS